MDPALKSKIVTEARAIQPQIAAWRRHIHQNPEPSFEEEQTGELVAGVLESFGLGVRRRVGKTGVVGSLNAPRSHRTVALRADMDALRICEATGLEFASKRPGVAHLCGHDAHVAMLLGAACVLSQIRDALRNSVRFLFQPAEEIPPGGATRLIEEGALDGVDEIFGLHVDPEMPTGAVGLRSGPSMAATDALQIRIMGKGAHAAMPHLGADPILAASHVILALQSIVSRRKNPMEPAVVSICKIAAGTQFNIIPEEASLGGTVRTLDESLREKMPQMIEETVRGAASAHGCQAHVQYRHGYPVLINHERSVQKAHEVVREILGKGADIREVSARMGGEDFALYLQKIPGALVRLGVTPPEARDFAPLHSPRFILDENALWVGTAVYASLACTD